MTTPLSTVALTTAPVPLAVRDRHVRAAGRQRAVGVVRDGAEVVRRGSRVHGHPARGPGHGTRHGGARRAGRRGREREAGDRRALALLGDRGFGERGGAAVGGLDAHLLGDRVLGVLRRRSPAAAGRPPAVGAAWADAEKAGDADSVVAAAMANNPPLSARALIGPYMCGPFSGELHTPAPDARTRACGIAGGAGGAGTWPAGEAGGSGARRHRQVVRRDGSPGDGWVRPLGLQVRRGGCTEHCAVPPGSAERDL